LIEQKSASASVGPTTRLFAALPKAHHHKIRRRCRRSPKSGLGTHWEARGCRLLYGWRAIPGADPWSLPAPSPAAAADCLATIRWLRDRATREYRRWQALGAEEIVRIGRSGDQGGEWQMRTSREELSREELGLVTTFLDQAQQRVSELPPNVPASGGPPQGASPQNPTALPPPWQLGAWYTLPGPPDGPGGVGRYIGNGQFQRPNEVAPVVVRAVAADASSTAPIDPMRAGRLAAIQWIRDLALRKLEEGIVFQT